MEGNQQMWGFKSFLDTVIDNGFHIGDSGGYQYNHLPPPPAHNHHNGPAVNCHGGVPLPTGPVNHSNHHSHHYPPSHLLSPQQSGPPPPHHHQSAGPYLDMDIKMEPDTLMDSGDYSPQSAYLGTLASSGSPSGSAGSPAEISASGRRKNKEDKLCGVCGDRALGYNFDAISCESCKAFFRRNAPKGLEYFKCPYDEKCKMDVSNRRFCKRCRLKKCFEIGMRKEYILTEEEKAKKRMKIEENRPVRDVDRPGLMPRPPVGVGGGEVTSQTHVLSPEDQMEIQELIQAYRSSLDVSTTKDFPRDMTSNMTHLVNIAELSVRRVIDMVKKVQSFKSLRQTDQIALLKGGSIELLILRSVISFDKEKQRFLDEKDSESKAMKIEHFQSGEKGTGLFEDHMKFIKSLAVDMNTDQTILILLLVISLFSPDRSNLEEKKLVAEQQAHYSFLLEKYLESIYPLNVARSMYPRLLMKLTDIRNLNEEHSQVLLKVNPEGIQPLMQEVLDIQRSRDPAPATEPTLTGATANLPGATSPNPDPHGLVSMTPPPQMHRLPSDQATLGFDH